MRLYQLMDAVLLTLAFSTIILTLVSYFLYKLRQVILPPGTEGIRGTRVYHLLFTQNLGRRAAVFLVLVAAVLFCSFTFQNFSVLNRIRRDRSEKLSVAQLSQRGLLRAYDFVEQDYGAILKEELPVVVKSSLEPLLAELHSVRLVLFAPAAEPQDQGRAAFPGAAKSLDAWTAWARTEGVPARRVARLPGLRLAPREVLVLPQIRYLKPVERKAIEAIAQEGGSVLATGALGMVWTEQAGDREAWLGRVLGLRFVDNPEKANYAPTAFSADARPLWEVPPGLVLNWAPLDNDFLALPAVSAAGAPPVAGSPSASGGPSPPDGPAATERPAAFQADRQGRITDPRVARIHFHELGRGRTAWLALEPGTAREGDDASAHYIREILARTVAWTAGLPLARAAFWKGGARSALALAVEADEKFDQVENLAVAIRAAGLPSTIFAASSRLRQNPRVVEAVSSDDTEFASRADQGEPLDGLPAREQFDRIQVSRLEIEELSVKRVRGLRPPAERYDEATLRAMLENRLDYLYGDFRFRRSAPVWIAGGRLLFIPRVAENDFGILRAVQAARGAPAGDAMAGDDGGATTPLASPTPTDVGDYIARDLERSRDLGALYALSLNTDVLGHARYRDVLERSLGGLAKAPRVWATTFEGLHGWWRTRSALRVRLSRAADRPPGTLTLEVTNSGYQIAEGIEIQVDPGKGRRLRDDGRAPDPAVGESLRVSVEPRDSVQLELETLASARQ